MAGKPFSVGAVPGAADLNNMAYIYDRVSATTDVVNLATEQTLYAVTITGGHLSTNRWLVLEWQGDYLNNSAGGKTLTVRVKYGGTTIWGDASESLTVSASRRDFSGRVVLANMGATNSQRVRSEIWLGMQAAGSVAGTGHLFGSVAANDYQPKGAPSWGTAAIDSTVNQTFAVTVQHSAADPNTSARLLCAQLELR